ncbi:MAG: hypothetical protein COA77_06290 [Thaumarchaeota archaeon]|nr:MAG: hypothetical protein COA77_06290 [Nitrososphaerota archaeon]
MKTILIFCLIVGVFPLLASVSGHGIGSETLPPQMIGNYNSTIFLKSSPNTADENIKEKQISLTIYDVETDEHLHNMKIDFTVSKYGEILFSNDFRIDEGTFSIIFSPVEELTIDETLDKLFDTMTKFGVNQIIVNENTFSEGGLYDFDIIVKPVDSFEDDLQDPVHFKGSLSIPKKFNFEVESDYKISITTFYDIIDSFAFSSDSMKFSMPFVWSDENISQVSVIHEEIHIPKSMSSWITNDYDLKINDIFAADSLITVDDYSIDSERIIHVIIPQRFLPEFKNDLEQMTFEILPNLSTNLPLVSLTTNGEYNVNLSWKPNNLIWGTPIIFEIKIEDTFVPYKIVKQIPFHVSLIQNSKILFEKTIVGVKNIESEVNAFQFIFDESHEGSVKIVIENIASNKFAQTEFVFVVNAPILKFPITIPSQRTDGQEGNYDVALTWIPVDLPPDEESEFIFTIYEKNSKIPVYDAYYEFVLIKDGGGIFRNSGIAPAGGYFEDFVFTEEHAGTVLVKLDKINNSEEYAEISVNVVPEFGLMSILILGSGFVIVLVKPLMIKSRLFLK